MINSDSVFAATRSEIAVHGLSRRRFIYSSLLAAGALATAPVFAAAPKSKSPNEKLNLGAIGVGGKGRVDMEGVSGENIVALCDVDETTLRTAAEKFPKARLYRDYRKMLEKEKGLDGVTISTPDHQHALAAMMAITSGKHVYCQKPLTHTIAEARALTLAARKHKVMTQMGNQGHSGEGNRELCEMIWSGVIGKVREVHCWTNRPVWPQGLTRPSGSDPVPSNLDWELWLGGAPKRPYVSRWPEEVAAKSNPNSKKKGRAGAVYHPFAWRGWWDFGCGALGDMGCHIMDGPQWALKLDAPTSVELVESSPLMAEMAPAWSIIRYDFPERGDLPACKLFWYDGGKKPAKPTELEAAELDENGALFIGEKGKMICGVYGASPRLLPESRMKDYTKPAQIIPRVPDNDPYKDWIRACKGGPAACSNFDVAGPFTEIVLLGNLALRLNKKIEWDAVEMRVKNAPEADPMIRKTYRKGWSV